MKRILIQTVVFVVLCTSNSFAAGIILVGLGNYPGGDFSLAGGYASGATGWGSFSFGHTCWATGSSSIAFGLYAEAPGYGSYSQGHQSKANGDWSVAIGDQAVAHDWMNRAFGYLSVAGDPDANINFGHCYAFGSQSIAKNYNTVALGALSQAIGEDSKSVGKSSVASGKSAVTLGESSTASGNQSTAIGQGSTASGDQSTAIGQGSTASGDQSTAIGQGSKALALHSVAVGPFPVARGNPTAWNEKDPVFTVANGESDTARSNALVVLKSGAVLVKESGDLSMGSFTDGIKPDDATTP